MGHLGLLDCFSLICIQFDYHFHRQYGKVARCSYFACIPLIFSSYRKCQTIRQSCTCVHHYEIWTKPDLDRVKLGLQVAFL